MFMQDQDHRDDTTIEPNSGRERISDEAGGLDTDQIELRIQIAVKDMVACLSTAGDSDLAGGQSAISVRRFAPGGALTLAPRTDLRPAAAPEWPRH